MDKARYDKENSRSVKRRLVIQGILELTSPTHLGGNDPLSLTDQPILRDHEGIPYIPGTTLAGLLRFYASTVLKKEGKDSEDEESSEIVALFGCRWGEENEEQSALIVDDAPMIEEQRQGIITELRDGVAIDPKTGIAADRKKFDQEWLPVGTRFRLNFEVLLKDVPPKNNKADEKCLKADEKCLRLLFTVLSALENEEIRLGGRTRRGHGSCRVLNWQHQSFDLTSIEGMRQWLGREGGVPTGWPKAEWKPKSVREMAQCYFSDPFQPEKAAKMVVNLSLSCSSSLLIRSEGYEAEGADAVHLHRLHLGSEKKEPVLSGTSLGGVLRHRALKIANTLALPQGNGKAKSFVEKLFGTEMTKGKRENLQASRIRVNEAVIEKDPALLRHTRVRIDRWRGSSLEHMLFTEDALFGGKVKVRLEVFDPSDAEIGLVLCLVKDLFTGDLPVGGESGVGRGILCGEEGQITWKNATGSGKISLQGDGKGLLQVTPDSAPTQPYFEALQKELKGEGV